MRLGAVVRERLNRSPKTLTVVSVFGRGLGEEILQRIGSRRRPQTGRHKAAGIRSWQYILKRLDSEDVERLLASWAVQQLPRSAELARQGEGPFFAIDGNDDARP